MNNRSRERRQPLGNVCRVTQDLLVDLLADIVVAEILDEAHARVTKLGAKTTNQEGHE